MMKTQKKEGKATFMIFILATLLVVPGIVFSLSFTSLPSINNWEPVYTVNDLICSWGESPDTTSANVTWYKNGVFNLSVVAAGTSHTLRSGNTSKNQEWTCEVTLINGTNILSQNVSVNISNSPQSVPVLYDATNTVLIPNNYELYEDTVYTFFINSTDSDGDVLTFGIAYDEEGICTVLNSVTGEITCLVEHEHITGSESPGPESPVTKDFWPSALATNPGLSVFDDNRTFYFVPVNDQAEFTQTFSSRSVMADAPWIIVINASDEENDFPLNFTFTSDILSSFPGIMSLTQTSDTTANLTFTTPNNAPENVHFGNWTVWLNVTDVNGSNSSRLPSQFSFTLEILTTNHRPVFITNFSNITITGNQTEPFLLYIYAEDEDVDDVVSFSVNSPSSPSCPVQFPWNITTLNSSYLNATSVINVSALTNSHVACRYLNISVKDQHNATTSEIVFFNISNVNDAPEIHEISFDEVNMTSQPPVFKYSNYIYRINATDVDNFTYDAANTGIITYFSNDSLFPVNSTTGVISVFISNDSFVNKNFTINLTVSDGFLNASRLMFLEVLNNSAPTLNLSSNNLTFFQNDSIEITFSATESDNETMNVSYSSLTSFSVLKYNITSIDNDYSGGYNVETWRLNMTNSDARIANSNVGYHLIYINVSDASGATEGNISTGILNFTILNINDPPFFDNDLNNVSDNVSLGNLTVNRTYSFIINATDFDLYLSPPFANESLTFNYSNASPQLKSVSFTKISSNSAMLNLTPNETGTFQITLNVTDSEGSYENQTVSFQVFLPTTNPVFQQVKPYFNSTLNITINNYTVANSVTNTTNIRISENQTWVFDALITNDTSYVGNLMSINWYVDSVLNHTVSAYLPGINSNLTLYFDFFSERQMNITMQATDARSSSSNWTWVVNVTNVNRPPVLINNLTNIESISGTTVITDYFTRGENNTIRFYDPDLTQLTYTMNFVSPSNGCGVFTFEAQGDSIRLTPLISDGLCVVSFNATDDYNETAVSNEVTISVEGFVPASGTATTSSQSGGSSTRTQIVTVPFEEEVDTPVPIKIIAPGTVSTYANRTIQIPLTLQNTWEDDIMGIALSGVALNASLANEPNVTIQFSDSYFQTIPFGGEVDAVLTISNYRREGPFEITVFARVENPEFTDSTTILINSLEQTSIGDEVNSKVTFAKDMLADNPECRELNELLDRAAVAVQNSNYADAVHLVDAVINGCKFLINQREESRREAPSILKTGFDFAQRYAVEIIYAAALLLILTLVFYAAAAVKKKISEIK